MWKTINKYGIMVAMNKAILFIARACFSLIFIVGAATELIDWEGTTQRLVLAFSEWSIYLGGAVMSTDSYEALISKSHVILGVALFLELVGALLVLTGLKIRIGAFFLLLFMVPVTVIIHPFWFSVGDQMQQEGALFLKNLSLIGALLYLLAGPQPQRESK